MAKIRGYSLWGSIVFGLPSHPSGKKFRSECFYEPMGPDEGIRTLTLGVRAILFSCLVGDKQSFLAKTPMSGRVQWQVFCLSSNPSGRNFKSECFYEPMVPYKCTKAFSLVMRAIFVPGGLKTVPGEGHFLPKSPCLRGGLAADFWSPQLSMW